MHLDKARNARSDYCTTGKGSEKRKEKEAEGEVKNALLVVTEARKH